MSNTPPQPQAVFIIPGPPLQARGPTRQPFPDAVSQRHAFWEAES